jgi:type III pantothenate kinase
LVDTSALYSIYPAGMTRDQERAGEMGQTAPVVAVCVGNTRTQIGLVRGGRAEEVQSLANGDLVHVAAEVAKLAEGADEVGDVPVVLASVNDPVAEQIERRLLAEFGIETSRIGRDVEISITHSLDDASTVGQDRLLNALGAFATLGQACVVIDTGTAVTVDFVDGVGTFHGGAIAPGVDMMLRALHERTAALPSIEFADPEPERGPLGKDTKHAMLLGVQAAAVGLVHRLIDRYAEFYGGYPSVIATGGNAAALFAGDELVERVVPELQLIGVGEACKRALADEDAED